MRRFDFELNTIFGGMVGIEYINLGETEEGGGAIVVDLLFLRLIIGWTDNLAE